MSVAGRQSAGPKGTTPVRFDRVARRALLSWYRRNARDLPWRRTRDPYRIWLSEVLLQQTRVETARPYYERMVRRFPTVEALAAARLDDVLKLWAGLGYYARARNLHKAARVVVREHGAEFPRTAEHLQRLPGVGRYTAGAIASIAFGGRVAAVDGNLNRVLARLFGIKTPIDRTQTQRRLWALAEELLPARNPGQFNQALMELGAHVCLPKRPACQACPVGKWCVANARGWQQRLPRQGPKKAVPRMVVVAAAVKRNGRYLLVRRPPRGLLAGLWKLPEAELRDGEPAADVVRRHLRELCGLDVSVGALLGTVRHAFSHRLLELRVYACEVCDGKVPQATRRTLRWVLPRRFGDYAFASVDRKALALLRTSAPDPTCSGATIRGV